MASFTVFDKFAEAFEMLDDASQKELAQAVMLYGFEGVEPEGIGVLPSVLFSAMREDIDNSITKRAAGSRGGSKGACKQVSGAGKPASKGACKQLSEDDEGACKQVSGAGNVASNPNQTRPDQSRPDQTKPDQGRPDHPLSGGSGGGAPSAASSDETGAEPAEPDGDRPKRFKPPTVEEVEAYCAKRGNGLDAEQFVAYYAQQGWRLKNGNSMKDWRMAVVNWERRRAEEKRKEGGYALPKAIADCIEWAYEDD